MPLVTARNRTLAAASLAVGLLAARDVSAGGHRADGTFQGNRVYILLGEDRTINDGDYVSASGGLGTSHRYFIEVPPGATQLAIDIFDADIHGPAGTENTFGLDLSDTDATTSCNYSLRNPSGTNLWNTTISENTNSAYDNTWTNFPAATQANPTPGHWEFRVNMSAGSDLNGFGFRAYETSATGTADREFNVYAPIASHGKTATTSNTRTFTDYPYITSGCSCAFSSFDYDGNATTTVTSRTGTFSTGVGGVSGNGVWAMGTVAGWVSEQQASDYGIWTRTLVLGDSSSNNNWSNSYFGTSAITAPGTPSSSIPTNSLRTYLPTDGNAAPVKPYVRQYIQHVSGVNPPSVGSVTRLRTIVDIVNPTPYAITFSNASSRTVRVNVPVENFAPGATPRNFYFGSTFTQGSIVSQPTTGGLPGGGQGNVIWDPGTVAAGATATLQVTYDTQPRAVGETVTVTGTVASNGTQAIYLDETGVAGSGSRGVMTFGPLCPLSYEANSGPLLVALDYLRARVGNDGLAVVEWATTLEESNAGFHVWRAIGEAEPVCLTTQLIPGLGDSLTGGEYFWPDPQPFGPGQVRRYWLVDHEFDGTTTWHGPVTVEPNQSLSGVGNWLAY